MGVPAMLVMDMAGMVVGVTVPVVIMRMIVVSIKM
jgi:hypothetical protein